MFFDEHDLATVTVNTLLIKNKFNTFRKPKMHLKINK